MAKTTVLTDDLDGSKAASTVTFAFRGETYELDLSKKNAAALDEVLRPYISAGRRASGSAARRKSSLSVKRTSAPRRSMAAKRDLTAVRLWAAENGHQIAGRGRIASSVLQAYDAAN